MWALCLLLATGKPARGLNILKKTHEVGLSSEGKISLANVGLRYCVATKALSHYAVFNQLLLTSAWVRKFQSLAIDPKHQQSLAHLSNYSDSEKKALLRLLIENRVGLRDVKRFSQAFKLVPLEAITMYVNTRMTGRNKNSYISSVLHW